ncbi:MAG: RING finger domain-containing protein [Promethearchaeota archaeon]
MAEQSERFIITSIKEIGEWKWTTSEKCIVCGLQIREGQEQVFCPNCGNPAHYSHLAEWVKVKGTCPICRKNIQMKRLEPKRK